MLLKMLLSQVLGGDIEELAIVFFEIELKEI
jgi:hypothetical protein